MQDVLSERVLGAGQPRALYHGERWEGGVKFQHLVGDEDLRSELLDRLDEIVAEVPGGLESLDRSGGSTAALLADGVERMAEGAWDGDDGTGLEAIVLRFTRPVLLVQDSTFAPALDGFPESEVVTERLTSAKSRLDNVIGSVGRVDLQNHRKDWVGTGWVVAPQVVVTNRHVAEEFAAAAQGGFGFRKATDGRTVKARLDWRREYQRGDEAVVVVDGVLWMEPDGEPDVALLHIADHDADGRPAPEPIPLMTDAEVDNTVGQWVAVIGYPARSPHNDLADQQRIFDGIYNLKRLAPGTVMAVSPDWRFTHDATTLGGNSGSVVIDLTTGKAVGLHFGGFEGDRNDGVKANVVASLVAQHA